ncbi:MAG: ATP synthase F1 subunit gamma [Elusimicrobiota bacterium]|jgi:F-type H+-transporting ATPase subunit gamma|nr:ATP synthase F1 subunit gamma [Elusimicrobiota bacterium]
MAQNLQAIKKRIRTSQSISQIAKAMEMIAASKIRRAEQAVERYKPYALKVTDIVQRILADKDTMEDEIVLRFTADRPGKKAIFIIGPDKGLCGGLVVNLFKEVLGYMNPEDVVISVGKKCINSSIRYGFNMAHSFVMGSAFPDHDKIFPLIAIARSLVFSGHVTKVAIVYTRFKNMLVQTPVVEEILPIKRDEQFVDNGIDYIMEPSVPQVLRDMIPYYFEVEFYNALMNAYASEQAARMAAMSNARDNADEISASLTNIYNRSRQEKITNEILDLANGQQGMQK